MGNVLCCENPNYLPLEERYNGSHHRTYNNNGHQYDSRDDPLLAYSNNSKYNYYNNRKNNTTTTTNNSNNNNKTKNIINKSNTIFSCSSCTYQHNYDFETCEMCGSSKNSTIKLTTEQIEERRQKTADAASARLEKQQGSQYEKKLKEKAKKLEEYEKRNRDIGGENHLRWRS